MLPILIVRQEVLVCGLSLLYFLPVATCQEGRGFDILCAMKNSIHAEIAMLVAFAVSAALSAIHPHSLAVWITEMFWAFGLLVVLLATRRKFRFSTAAYMCFFVWMILQSIGAHWTFELVPMDWLKEPLGLVRNPYDRIAHFTVGWFAFPMVELFHRKGWVKSAGVAAFFAVMTTIAMAGLWELVEWQYAVIDGGEAGAAFLGSQGDEWDAQKDILCDTLGALCAVTTFMIANKRLLRDGKTMKRFEAI